MIFCNDDIMTSFIVQDPSQSEEPVPRMEPALALLAPRGARRSVLEVEGDPTLEALPVAVVGKATGGGIDLEAVTPPGVPGVHRDGAEQQQLRLHSWVKPFMLYLLEVAGHGVAVTVVGREQPAEIQGDVLSHHLDARREFSIQPCRAVLAQLEVTLETCDQTPVTTQSVPDFCVEAEVPLYGRDLPVLEVDGPGADSQVVGQCATDRLGRADVQERLATRSRVVKEVDSVGVPSLCFLKQSTDAETIGVAPALGAIRIEHEAEFAFAGVDLPVSVPRATVRPLEVLEGLERVLELDLSVDGSFQLLSPLGAHQPLRGLVPHLLDLRLARDGGRARLLRERGAGNHPQQDNREHHRDDPGDPHGSPPFSYCLFSPSVSGGTLMNLGTIPWLDPPVYPRGGNCTRE